MRLSAWLRNIVGAIALVTPLSAAAQEAFHDDAGRAVTLPPQVEKVWPAGPPAEALVYIVAPEKLLGWTHPVSAEAKALMSPAAAALPVIGRLTGRGNTASLEAVVQAAPDLVLDVGSVNPTYISLADRVAAQTHIPYVLIGGSLAETPALLRKAGTVLRTPDRAAALARYAAATLDEIAQRVRTVPAGERPKIYLARGPRGLTTDLKGSINGEALDLVGALNVAAASSGGNLADVSLEQVLAWQPDIIVAIDRNFATSVATDAQWQGVKAVQEKRVYLAPRDPFGWIDEPPGPNRIIGLRWLAKLLYPRLFPEDLRAETKQFYELFYHETISDAQLDQLLGPQG
jgi:iron complex transport system substrate-binding protein